MRIFADLWHRARRYRLTAHPDRWHSSPRLGSAGSNSSHSRSATRLGVERRDGVLLDDFAATALQAQPIDERAQPDGCPFEVDAVCPTGGPEWSATNIRMSGAAHGEPVDTAAYRDRLWQR